MSKITLEQLKEQQQISSLDEYTNADILARPTVR